MYRLKTVLDIVGFLFFSFTLTISWFAEDVNAKDSSRWTALMTASAEGHTDAVKLLLSNGAYDMHVPL
ncbi:ankyrin repeat domain-containing protein [Caldisericum sp.]|uniref:ankyrin repeat domain-containing protein n=1 Tax=Caldisericum sp. TaxID=2499687 RepID=UPI003D0D0C6B